MWEEVRDLSGEKTKGNENERGSKANPLKSRKGFGYDVRKAKRRPSNAANGDLLGSEILTGLGVGTIKEGVALEKDKAAGPVFLPSLSLAFSLIFPMSGFFLSLSLQLFCPRQLFCLFWLMDVRTIGLSSRWKETSAVIILRLGYIITLKIKIICKQTKTFGWGGIGGNGAA